MNIFNYQDDGVSVQARVVIPYLQCFLKTINGNKFEKSFRFGKYEVNSNETGYIISFTNKKSQLNIAFHNTFDNDFHPINNDIIAWKWIQETNDLPVVKDFVDCSSTYESQECTIKNAYDMAEWIYQQILQHKKVKN